MLTADPAQVWDTAAALNLTAEPGLQSLEQQLAARPEPLRAVRRLQGLLDALLGYTAAIPFWGNPAVSLEALAEQVDLYDWYRCARPLLPAPAQRALQGQASSTRAWWVGWSGGVCSSRSGRSPRGAVCLRGIGLQATLPRNGPWARLFAWALRLSVWMPGLPARAARPTPPCSAGGWATWACCCWTWPSACWRWSASSAAPRASSSGECGPATQGWGGAQAGLPESAPPHPPSSAGQAQGLPGEEPQACVGGPPGVPLGLALWLASQQVA